MKESGMNATNKVTQWVRP